MPDEDKALASEFFPSSKLPCFCSSKPGNPSIGDARFCFWGEGELFDWPLMVFPFDADELAVEEGRRRPSKGRDQSQDSFAGLAEVAASVGTGAGNARASSGRRKTPVPAPNAETAGGVRQALAGSCAGRADCGLLRSPACFCISGAVLNPPAGTARSGSSNRSSGTARIVCRAARQRSAGFVEWPRRHHVEG